MRAVTVSLPGLSIHSPHGSFLMNTDPRESPALQLLVVGRNPGLTKPRRAGCCRREQVLMVRSLCAGALLKTDVRLFKRPLRPPV
jgi:hypothetical protein